MAIEETQYWAEYFYDYLSPEEDPYQPVSDFYVPIFDTDTSSVKVDANKSKVGKLLFRVCQFMPTGEAETVQLG